MGVTSPQSSANMKLYIAESFLSFFLKTKVRRRKLVRTKIVQHAIFYLGVYFHIGSASAEKVRISKGSVRAMGHCSNTALG